MMEANDFHRSSGLDRSRFIRPCLVGRNSHFLEQQIHTVNTSYDQHKPQFWHFGGYLSEDPIKIL